MLLSKANLLIIQVASTDANRAELTGLRIEADGSTVASNGFILLAVEPLAAAEATPTRVVGAGMLEAGVTVYREDVAEVLRALPKELEMQVAAVRERADGFIEFTTRNRRQERKVAGRPLSRLYHRWRDILRGAFGAARAYGIRLAVSRAQLLALVNCVNAACPDPSGTAPIFLEIAGETEPVIVRSINYQTGQRVVGMFYPVKAGDNWLPYSRWEARLFATLEKKQVE